MTMKRTALYDLHLKYGGKMVEFAGYEMPVQFKETGVMVEHMHVREHAGLFDVSHMGQVFISGEIDPAAVLESVIPSDLKNQKIGQMRYTVLLNDQGGIMDDLIVTRLSETSFYIVVNAARIDVDIPYIKTILGDNFTLRHTDDRVLIALQGPKAEAVLAEFYPECRDLTFMRAIERDDMIIARAGYTGEDGFELSLPKAEGLNLAEKLLDHKDVLPIALGARDSLRLEAGLCLYGHDMDEGHTPIEASLGWVMQKKRREAADFVGAERILNQRRDGAPTYRVGLLPEGRAPLREGVKLYNMNDDEIGEEIGKEIGVVTSGTFSPCLKRPVAMGYVDAAYKTLGSKVVALLRGKHIKVEISALPFIETRVKKS